MHMNKFIHAECFDPLAQSRIWCIAQSFSPLVTETLKATESESEQKIVAADLGSVNTDVSPINKKRTIFVQCRYVCIWINCARRSRVGWPTAAYGREKARPNGKLAHCLYCVLPFLSPKSLNRITFAKFDKNARHFKWFTLFLLSLILVSFLLIFSPDRFRSGAALSNDRYRHSVDLNTEYSTPETAAQKRNRRAACTWMSAQNGRASSAETEPAVPRAVRRFLIHSVLQLDDSGKSEWWTGSADAMTLRSPSSGSKGAKLGSDARRPRHLNELYWQ